MKKNGFTLVEMMIALIILVVLITALWRVFSATNKNAQEVMENSVLNDELDRTLLKIMDDVREANQVATWPKQLEDEELDTFKTDNPDNKLEFVKVDYNFTIPPTSSGNNYTYNKITYKLERENEENDNSKWILIRETEYHDSNGEIDESRGSIIEVLKGLDECLFYRLKDPDAARTGNIYIKIKKGRQDKKDEDDMKYTSESLISVKERGAMPES